MKRLWIFLAFASLGTAMLLHFGGSIAGPKREQPKPVVQRHDGPESTPGGHPITTEAREIHDVRGIYQTAPPERVVWRDKLSDEEIVIPVFIRWRFRSDDLLGTQPADADSQGAVCHNVRFLIYRPPATRAEALALVRRDVDTEEAYGPLLNQTFEADEAHVFGRLGEALNRKKRKGGGAAMGDTRLILSGNVHIIDAGQGLDIRGEPTTEVTVWPEQGRAVGKGPFLMAHEAFDLTGVGLEMEHERESGWSRVKIQNKPVLRIHSDVHDANGKPMFDYGGGDFQPTHVVSRGGAILKREMNRRETVITITFTDRVHAEQQGGRSLDAGRVELTASKDAVPRSGAASAGWNLQRFMADDKVEVVYPGRTSKGEAYLASITADRLVHVVPAEGLATTELEGNVVMHMRGEIPLLGPDGRIVATCRDRAWIGPHRPGAPTGGHAPAKLQLIGLRGDARIERTEHGATRTEDLLEGDAIDLVVLPRDGGAAARDEAAPASGMIAVHFAALGDVRLGGTRIRGSTHRLVGDRLDTDRPHILAEGEGTRFSFPDIGSEQRLLGPGGEGEKGGAPSTGPGPLDDGKPEGKWVLQRLLATGMVHIDTSLGGPALGIPAQLSGDELSYSRVSQQAQVIGRGGRQARVAWTAPTGEISHLETRTLTLDQARGRLTAEGGVDGEFYVSREGSSSSPFPRGGTAGSSAGPSTLSVRTDESIDVELVRDPASGGAQAGREQIIRIAGPLTADLRSSDRSVDRMRAQSLELALVYAVEEVPLGPERMAPTARAGGEGRRPSTTPKPAAGLERVALTAGRMRLDLADGEARYIEAATNVEMESKEGRVTGDRLIYDGQRRQVEVLSDPSDWRKRPAVAWLGAGDERMEVKGGRLALTLDGGASRTSRATLLQADAPNGAPAEMQLYRRSGKSGNRQAAGREWFTLTYWGTARMTDDAVTIGPSQTNARGHGPRAANQNVRIVRRVRKAGTTPWGPPAILWSPSLRVVGKRMLASEGATRDVQRIIARGADTTMQSGAGPDQVQIWGDYFDFDVHTSKATLRGENGRDVRIKREGPPKVDSLQKTIIIDMNTNLPTYVEGSRIRWQPKKPPRVVPKKPK